MPLHSAFNSPIVTELFEMSSYCCKHSVKLLAAKTCKGSCAITSKTMLEISFTLTSFYLAERMTHAGHIDITH